MYRHRSQQTVLAFLILCSAFAGATASADPEHSPFVHLRTSCPWIRAAIVEAYRESPTFRRLVDQIEAASTFVFVEDRSCGVGADNPCTLIGSSGPGGRFLQIRAGHGWNQAQLTGILAHELQHATEIIQDPDVVDARSLRSLYRRIGFLRGRLGTEESWETNQARETQRIVVEETYESRRLARDSARR
jgi:hypothetical protein